MGMKESDYLTPLGKLERSESWGFGDAFWLIIDYAKPLGQAHSPDKKQWDKTYDPIADVWTALEDAIRDGLISIKSGDLKYIGEGPMLAYIPDDSEKDQNESEKGANTLVIDKKSFLSWYRRDKEKIMQYLSCADLKIHQEEFLDRLAKTEPRKTPHPKTNKAKKDRLREDYIASVAKKFKDKPDLQFPDFKNDYGLQKLIRLSSLPEDKRPKDSTLQRWVGMARKVSKVKPRIGRAGKSGKKA